MATLPDPPEMTLLRVAHPLPDHAPVADLAEHLLERSFDLGLDDRRPVVVVRREDAAATEDARRLGERRVRLHPVERLRAGDEVRTAVREAGRLRVGLDEA